MPGNRPAEALYDDAAARPLLVYRVCEYLRIAQDGCRQCDRMVEVRGEQCFRGCYMIAEEIIAVVNEGLRKPIGQVEQDNSPRPNRAGRAGHRKSITDTIRSRQRAEPCSKRQGQKRAASRPQGSIRRTTARPAKPGTPKDHRNDHSGYKNHDR